MDASHTEAIAAIGSLTERQRIERGEKDGL